MPERGHLVDLERRRVVAERLAQRLLQPLALRPGRQVDEVDDDGAAEIAQPDLPGDLGRGREVDVQRRAAAAVDVDRDAGRRGLDQQPAAAAPAAPRAPSASSSSASTPVCAKAGSSGSSRTSSSGGRGRRRRRAAAPAPAAAPGRRPRSSRGAEVDQTAQQPLERRSRARAAGRASPLWPRPRAAASARRAPRPPRSSASSGRLRRVPPQREPAVGEELPGARSRSASPWRRPGCCAGSATLADRAVDQRVAEQLDVAGDPRTLVARPASRTPWTISRWPSWTQLRGSAAARRRRPRRGRPWRPAAPAAAGRTRRTRRSASRRPR